MNELLSNTIVQSVLATLIVTSIIMLINLARNKYLERKILLFLKHSLKSTDNIFRTTHAISSGVNISEEKIRKICSKSKKISRNSKEKESWRLT